MYVYADNANVDLETLMDDPTVAELMNRKAKEGYSGRIYKASGSFNGL